MPEGDSFYEATDLYTSDSDRSSSPAKNVIPPRLRNLPPIPPEAERTPPSGGGKMSPKDRSKLAEPPTVRRQVPEKHPKTAITPPSGKNKQQTASSAAPSKGRLALFYASESCAAPEALCFFLVRRGFCSRVENIYLSKNTERIRGSLIITTHSL